MMDLWIFVLQLSYSTGQSYTGSSQYASGHYGGGNQTSNTTTGGVVGTGLETNSNKRLQGHPLKSFSVPAPPPQSAPSTPAQQKHGGGMSMSFVDIEKSTFHFVHSITSNSETNNIRQPLQEITGFHVTVGEKSISFGTEPHAYLRRSWTVKGRSWSNEDVMIL